MCGAECLARQAFQEIAGNCLAGRETDRMQQAVELAPGLAQVAEQRFYLLVAADVAREDQFAVELLREIDDPVLEAVADIGECQLGAFTFAGLGDAVCDGTVGQQARDQNFFALQERHGATPECQDGQDCRASCGAGQPRRLARASLYVQ